MGYSELDRSRAQREIERAALRETLRRQGVKVVVFDADETLLRTHDVFQRAFADVYSLLASAGTNPYAGAGELPEQLKAFKTEFYGVIGRLREEFRVNPTMFGILINEMTRRFGQPRDGELASQVHERLEHIYTHDRYEPFSGAHEAVEDFGAAAERTFVMTHAGHDHSRRKFGTAGLLTSFTDIVAMDVGRKKSLQWQEQFYRHGIDPTEAMVIGDNLGEDLDLPLQQGARGVWLHHDKPITEDQAKLLATLAPHQDRLHQTGFIHQVIPVLIGRA